jgi:hypothetical protein
VHLGPLPTQPLTGIKYKRSIKLNIYVLYWYFQENHCLCIKRHAVYNMHKLTWSPYNRGVHEQLRGVPMGQDDTVWRLFLHSFSRSYATIYRWSFFAQYFSPLYVDVSKQIWSSKPTAALYWFFVEVNNVYNMVNEHRRHDFNGDGYLSLIFIVII